LRPQFEVQYADGVILFKDIDTTYAFVRFTDQAEIEYIFVRPSYRRLGLATQLIYLVKEVTGHPPKPMEPISLLGHKFFKLN
jgi:GNAT superfamily N-acetyltransferase